MSQSVAPRLVSATALTPQHFIPSIDPILAQ